MLLIMQTKVKHLLDLSNAMMEANSLKNGFTNPAGIL
jgi:hypothetical protein